MRPGKRADVRVFLRQRDVGTTGVAAVGVHTWQMQPANPWLPKQTETRRMTVSRSANTASTRLVIVDTMLDGPVQMQSGAARRHQCRIWRRVGKANEPAYSEDHTYYTPPACPSH